MRSIRSMYWKNINPLIVQQQKRVLESLGYEIIQDEADGVSHGIWLTQTLEDAGEDDVILFLDIDAFPLNKDVVERAFAAAEAGKVIGVAQTANHLPTKDVIYAAPAFLAVSRAIWAKLGKPSMMKGRDFDAGGALSDAAWKANVPVELIYPSFVGIPLWRLSDQGVTGIATIYESDVFHLFKSRRDQLYKISLDYLADCVVEQKPIDYLWLHRHLNSDAIKRTQIREDNKVKARKKRERFFANIRAALAPAKRDAH